VSLLQQAKVLILDLHATSRLGALLFLAFCVISLATIHFSGWLPLSELLEFSSSSFNAESFVTWSRGFALATVLLLVFFILLVLFNALGSNLAIFDTEKQLFRWKRHLFWIPVPGFKIPFEDIESLSQRRDSKMSHAIINGAIRIYTHQYKELVLDIRGRAKPFVLFTFNRGKDLPGGYSASSIAEKLGWERRGWGWAPASRA
jgi:hypothetical protein